MPFYEVKLRSDCQKQFRDTFTRSCSNIFQHLQTQTSIESYIIQPWIQCLMPSKQWTDVGTDFQLHSLSRVTLNLHLIFDPFPNCEDLQYGLWLHFIISFIMMQEIGFSGSNSVLLCVNVPLTLLTRFSWHHEMSPRNCSKTIQNQYYKQSQQSRNGSDIDVVYANPFPISITIQHDDYTPDCKTDWNISDTLRGIE